MKCFFLPIVACSIHTNRCLSIFIESIHVCTNSDFPDSNSLEVTIEEGSSITVSCVFNAEDEYALGNPPASNFYIFANDILIPKPISESSVTVDKPDGDTVFMCVGGNYMGNVTASDTYINEGMCILIVYDVLHYPSIRTSFSNLHLFISTFSG